MEKKSARVFKKRVSKAKKQEFAVRTLRKNYGTLGTSGYFDSLSQKKHNAKKNNH